MKYDVTIGIPVYKSVDYIKRSLESALSQSYLSVEFLRRSTAPVTAASTQSPRTIPLPSSRIAEDAADSISWGGVTMKYGVKIVGKPDENGLYPLYIALHGGGSDETGKINDDQWRQMAV